MRNIVSKHRADGSQSLHFLWHVKFLRSSDYSNTNLRMKWRSRVAPFVLIELSAGQLVYVTYNDEKKKKERKREKKEINAKCNIFRQLEISKRCWKLVENEGETVSKIHFGAWCRHVFNYCDCYCYCCFSIFLETQNSLWFYCRDIRRICDRRACIFSHSIP